MKQIFFVRHAKSSWADSSLSDIDRPLNKRGKRDAPFMAKKLAEILPDVDLILCSPARRARDTAKSFTKEINYKNFEVNSSVYHAWTDTLIDVLRSLNEDVKSVIVFGHNPGYTSLYNKFSNNYLDNLPTCGIFGLSCSVQWNALNSTNTRVNQLIYPKLYLT